MVYHNTRSPVFLSTRTTGSMFEKLPRLRSLANTFQGKKGNEGLTPRKLYMIVYTVMTQNLEYDLNLFLLLKYYMCEY